MSVTSKTPTKKEIKEKITRVPRVKREDDYEHEDIFQAETKPQKLSKLTHGDLKREVQKLKSFNSELIQLQLSLIKKLAVDEDKLRVQHPEPKKPKYSHLQKPEELPSSGKHFTGNQPIKERDSRTPRTASPASYHDDTKQHEAVPTDVKYTHHGKWRKKTPPSQQSSQSSSPQSGQSPLHGMGGKPSEDPKAGSKEYKKEEEKEKKQYQKVKPQKKVRTEEDEKRSRFAKFVQDFKERTGSYPKKPKPSSQSKGQPVSSEGHEPREEFEKKPKARKYYEGKPPITPKRSEKPKKEEPKEEKPKTPKKPKDKVQDKQPPTETPAEPDTTSPEKKESKLPTKDKKPKPEDKPEQEEPEQDEEKDEEEDEEEPEEKVEPPTDEPKPKTPRQRIADAVREHDEKRQTQQSQTPQKQQKPQPKDKPKTPTKTGKPSTDEKKPTDEQFKKVLGQGKKENKLPKRSEPVKDKQPTSDQSKPHLPTKTGKPKVESKLPSTEKPTNTKLSPQEKETLSSDFYGKRENVDQQGVKDPAAKVPAIEKHRKQLLRNKERDTAFKNTILGSKESREYFNPDNPESLTAEDIPSLEKFYTSVKETTGGKPIPKTLFDEINRIDNDVNKHIRTSESLRKKYPIIGKFLEDPKTKEGVKTPKDEQGKSTVRPKITSENIAEYSPDKLKKLISERGFKMLTTEERALFTDILSGKHPKSEKYFNMYKQHPLERQKLITEIRAMPKGLSQNDLDRRAEIQAKLEGGKRLSDEESRFHLGLEAGKRQQPVMENRYSTPMTPPDKGKTFQDKFTWNEWEHWNALTPEKEKTEESWGDHIYSILAQRLQDKNFKDRWDADDKPDDTPKKVGSSKYPTGAKDLHRTRAGQRVPDTQMSSAERALREFSKKKSTHKGLAINHLSMFLIKSNLKSLTKYGDAAATQPKTDLYTTALIVAKIQPKARNLYSRKRRKRA